MKQRRDLSQIRTFCLQVDPTNFRSLMEAYHDATREAHSHIIFYFHPRQKDHLRIRSGLLENQDKVIYIPKSVYKSSMLTELWSLLFDGSHGEHHLRWLLRRRHTYTRICWKFSWKQSPRYAKLFWAKRTKLWFTLYVRFVTIHFLETFPWPQHKKQRSKNTNILFVNSHKEEKGGKRKRKCWFSTGERPSSLSYSAF